MRAMTIVEMAQLVSRLEELEKDQRAFAKAIRPIDKHVADTALSVAAGIMLARDVVSGVPF